MISTLDERFKAGHEVEVAASTAARWIERGYAIPVREPEIERAVVSPPEKTVKRSPRKRKAMRHVEPAAKDFGSGD